MQLKQWISGCRLFWWNIQLRKFWLDECKSSCLFLQWVKVVLFQLTMYRLNQVNRELESDFIILLLHWGSSSSPVAVARWLPTWSRFWIMRLAFSVRSDWMVEMARSWRWLVLSSASLLGTSTSTELLVPTTTSHTYRRQEGDITRERATLTASVTRMTMGMKRSAQMSYSIPWLLFVFTGAISIRKKNI